MGCRHPQFTKHRTKLIDLLSSGQSDADVSNTIAELVGYDELDFVMKLVSARHALISKVCLNFAYVMV